MENDLISRADALTEVEIIADGYWHHEVIRKTRELLMQNIKAIPAVDALEVVRCENCTMHNDCKFEQYQGLNGFCSLGERKENGK